MPPEGETTIVPRRTTTFVGASKGSVPVDPRLASLPPPLHDRPLPCQFTTESVGIPILVANVMFRRGVETEAEGMTRKQD